MTLLQLTSSASSHLTLAVVELRFGDGLALLYMYLSILFPLFTLILSAIEA